MPAGTLMSASYRQIDDPQVRRCHDRATRKTSTRRCAVLLRLRDDAESGARGDGAPDELRDARGAFASSGEGDRARSGRSRESDAACDPFPIHFELVPATIMYEFGAYGLPGRFSHWTHGEAYHQMKTMYDYGLCKIYELVINTNPAYAFLMESNSLIQNKLVVAHVLGHSDFFKNNVYFEHTNRADGRDASASTRSDPRATSSSTAREEVEKFLDAVLSIQEHIDPNLRVLRKPGRAETRARAAATARPPTAVRRPAGDLGEARSRTPRPAPRKFPPEPEKDLLLFLAEHAPELEDGSATSSQIVRAEMLYFLPQMQTKIMNEGWASLWHARIMRELDLTREEYIEFARLHAGVLSPSPRGRINPYYVGFKIFEDIERRWNGT